MKKISRTPVDSSSIVSMGYDEAGRLLDIEFPSGEIYRYFNVPAWEYENFMSAPSKGTYLNQHFKAAEYRYERITSET